jgi:hypothetical protein
MECNPQTACFLKLTNSLTRSRTTRLLVDSEDRVIGILGGQPKNAKEWEKICKEAVEALENGRGLCTFLDKQLNHGRGDFPAVAVGISHGNGTQVSGSPRGAPSPPIPTFTQAPGVLSQGKNAKVLGDLLGMSCFAKMAGFANCKGGRSLCTLWELIALGLFATYFPRAYALYQENLEELIQWDPSLRRNFPKTAFAAASFNFGPKTECYPHRDWANVSWGECAVTALGDYNADEGGHLVLWDLGLVVRFPPGSTVLIPSALVRHSNTPIAPCEHRYSFAQYSAGGLFRWVGRGFRLAKAKPAESTDIQQSRWTKGMGVFSKLSEF